MLVLIHVGSTGSPEDDRLVSVLDLPNRFAFLWGSIQELFQFRMELLEAPICLRVREVNISIRTRRHDVELGIKDINALRTTASNFRARPDWNV